MLSPLTGRSDTQLIRKLSAKTISKQWMEQLGVDVGKDFIDLPSIEHWRCDTTGLEWYYPQQAAGQGELYSQLESFDWYYMPEKWEFHTALDLLNKNESVLEVGVGEGYFLSAASKNGIHVSGIELNPSAAARARARGFEIYETDLASLAETTGQKYDVICSFQVLEHVSDPRKFLNGMLGLLRPGGRLILSVPNAAVMRTIDPEYENLFDQPPHHVSHWDEHVFRALDGLLPLRVCRVIREPLQLYHIDWFVRSYANSKWKKIFTKDNDVIRRMFINRFTLLPIRLILAVGLRRLIPGHTLLVELESSP